MAVYAIGSYIINNKLQIGSPLPPEGRLADELGISRNIIREAMRHYRTIGVIETKTKVGASVARLLPDDPYKNYMPFLVAEKENLLLELVEARISLETGAAELIVKKISDTEIAKLAALQQQMSQAKQILEEQLPLDEQFHSQLLRCTHNRFLIGMIPLLVEFFAKILPEFSRLRQTSYEASFEEHAKIIEALRIHDGVRLERLLRAHLDVYLELK